MPATVRDILLMIRAKEDVSRSMGAVAGSMRRASTAADAASARARAAALRAAASQSRINGATTAQVRALQNSAGAWDRQAKAIQTSSTRTKDLAGRAQHAGQVMQTAGLAMMAAGVATAYGLKQAVDVASAWDRQVRLTFTQVDKRFKPSLKELSDIGLRVSRDIAVPFEKIQEALFDVFSSTEANMPQAETLLRAFAKAAVAGQTDVQTASRATIGLMNSFKIPFKDVNKLLDIQFQLVQEGVGTYEEWANRIGLVSPSAVRAGQSIETMAAALATATRSGMNAARASTSVARAFDAMSNPKTEKNLKKIGVATRDAKGNFRPLVDVLTDWRKQIEKMPKADRVEHILDVLKGAGGTIEARRFLQNVLLSKGGLELFQDQIKEFARDKGAFQRAYNDMADSVAAKGQILRNSWSQVKLAIGNALIPHFIKLIEYVQKVLDWFDKLSPRTKNLISQFLFWGSILAVVGGAIVGFIGALVGLGAVVVLAGKAILIAVGAVVAIGTAIGAVVIGVIALAAGFYLLYQRSENFRKVISTLWDIITGIGSVIKTFALDVWNAFNTYVMPALRDLYDTFNTHVLPVIQEGIAWFRDRLLPVLREVSDMVMYYLKDAFKQFGDMIREDVIPVLQNFRTWVEQNAYWLKPLATQLIIGAAAFALFAGAALIGAIKFLGWLVSKTFEVIDILMKLSIVIKGSVVTALNIAIGIVKLVINWLKNLGKGAKEAGSTMLNALKNAASDIKGVFSGAGTWLLDAGRNIVMGLVNGIKGMIGSAIGAAKGLAGSVAAAARNALVIKSPSRVFRDIGINVVRGLIVGIRDSKTVKQLQASMHKVIDAVYKSIRSADINLGAKRQMAAKWSKRLTGAYRQLTTLENRRITVQNRLAAAQKSVNDQIEQRNDLAEKVTEAIRKSSDITTLSDKEQATTSRMVTGLQKRLKAAQDFAKNLRTLAARGFDKETIAQLASQGVETAGKMVATLAAGSQSDLNAISKIQAEIRALAGDTGGKVAGDLYNAGIKAGQGLIKGLQSQMAAITKQMQTIANALVAAIKRELGIKSPSRVFQDIGVNTAKGYVNGYVRHLSRNLRGMAAMTVFTPQGPRMALSSRGTNTMAGTQIIRNYDQKITVNTHELDPRKQAADLGWELQGRLP